MSAVVLFRGDRLGARRDQIVKRFRFPSEGVTKVDDNTLAINHTRRHQAEFTREEMERVLGTQVVIV